MFYYIFWLKSSRGTDELTVRAYKNKPTRLMLGLECQGWAKHFGAWTASENLVRYGWRTVKPSLIPKNRRDAIKRFSVACKAYEIARLRKKVVQGILMSPPFNGMKAK